MSCACGQGLAEQVKQLLALQAQLTARLTDLEARLERAERERDEYRKLHMLAREENERLKHGLIGQKAQRPPADDRQLTLDIMGLLLGDQEKDGSHEERHAVVPQHTRRKAVRKPLPEHLERVSFELIPEEVERDGRDAFDVIGVDRREVLERRPASLVVVETIRPKFVRKADKAALSTEVLSVAPAELPIEKGMAGPGLLADTVVKRWQDHLPLHRQEAIYARDGIELNRSTICTWHGDLAQLVKPLVEAMRLDALLQPYLCVDATGVLVQHPERCKRGHFWVMVAPRRHVLYEFSMNHDGKAVDDFLGNFKGYLVADAHVVYDHVFGDGKAIEVGCWCHLRKYVLDAYAVDPDVVREGLACIQALFMIERDIKHAPSSLRSRERDHRSRPLVEQFFKWCKAQKETALDGSPLHAATRYATNQRAALERFLEDQRLPLHNNISELNLRRQAVGRKAWLFVGSEDGGHVNTRFVSLLASCAMHKIEPWAYLRDLFCLLPNWPINRVLELAPVNWRDTLTQPEVQQKLDANLYRRVTLMHPLRAVA